MVNEGTTNKNDSLAEEYTDYHKKIDNFNKRMDDFSEKFYNQIYHFFKTNPKIALLFGLMILTPFLVIYMLSYYLSSKIFSDILISQNFSYLYILLFFILGTIGFYFTVIILDALLRTFFNFSNREFISFVMLSAFILIVGSDLIANVYSSAKPFSVGFQEIPNLISSDKFTLTCKNVENNLRYVTDTYIVCEGSIGDILADKNLTTVKIVDADYPLTAKISDDLLNFGYNKTTGYFSISFFPKEGRRQFHFSLWAGNNGIFISRNNVYDAFTRQGYDDWNKQRLYSYFLLLSIGLFSMASLVTNVSKMLSKNSINHVEIGDNYTKMGEYNTALENYRMAMTDSSGQDAEIFNKMGETYLHLGEKDKAKKCFELTLEIDKRDVNAKEWIKKLEDKSIE